MLLGLAVHSKVPLSLESCSIRVSALSSFPYTIIATARARALKDRAEGLERIEVGGEKVKEGVVRVIVRNRERGE